MSTDAYLGAALPLVVLVSLGSAAVIRSPVQHARVTREGGTFFLGERTMHRAYTSIDLVAAVGGGCGVPADAVSWLSLLAGLTAGLLAACGLLGTASWALALSGLCDGLDGAIARRTGITTPAGAVLDSALDRYVSFSFALDCSCISPARHFFNYSCSWRDSAASWSPSPRPRAKPWASPRLPARWSDRNGSSGSPREPH